MSILAEPRRKQRISVDPQNLQWANDDSKFGKKLMQQMGWKDGEGLGVGGRGSAQNLKVKANLTGKGLGATGSYDETWIAHHDDFADLLTALNAEKTVKDVNEEEAEDRVKKVSLELTCRSLKRRINYQRFTKAKDLNNYDDNDRKAVLGVGLKTKNKKSREEKAKAKKAEDDSDDAEKEEPTNHTVSTLSVGDYFKEKMAAKLAALNNASADVAPNSENEPEEVAEPVEQPKKKKSKKDRKEPREEQVESINTEEPAEEETSRKKKKKSKMQEAEECEAELIETEEPPKKKKKKERVEEAEDAFEQEDSGSSEKRKKDKKKRRE
ncbi:unnamed protein product, partial [Mesorhabditis spiculigera]